MPDFSLFDTVGIDAWTGTEAAVSPLDPKRDSWAVTEALLPAGKALLPPPPANPEDWTDERIGWGLILPDREGFTPEQLARGDDAPEPLRDLLAARPVSKVLRYISHKKYHQWVLRDYQSGDRPIATSPVGTGPDGIPAYLLIAGSPAEIPWELQYQLNLVRKVGRLDLPPDGLRNYVYALISGWKDSKARYSSPLVWAVDHGNGDITSLMREAVAAPMHADFMSDSDLNSATFIDGRTAEATSDALKAALQSQKPAIIVSTSHGLTGPLDRVDEMRQQMGGLVDIRHQIVDPASLLMAWQPDGAVWLAQACCSAGAQSPSMYQGMFDSSSLVGSVLEGVAAVGPMVAPLPRALLGAPRPLRAFIGHVEPTFDWTMMFPPNRQQLTSWVRETLYAGVCAGLPVGLAMEKARLYGPVGALLMLHSHAVESYAVALSKENRRSGLDMAMYSKVTAYDRACTVLLGDPTVSIPVPHFSG